MAYVSGTKVLEFYSGIGGMHYALKAVDSKALVVAAFDINNFANDVYSFNFGFRPVQVGDWAAT